jgi:omega-amidase
VANWPKVRSNAWRTLLKARAIENQAYVIGVNRVGEDNQEIKHSGDTTVVDANGDVIRRSTQYRY